MPKKCNPSRTVRTAGKNLSKSKSASTKSKAGKTLANHKKNNH